MAALEMTEAGKQILKVEQEKTPGSQFQGE